MIRLSNRTRRFLRRKQTQATLSKLRRYALLLLFGLLGYTLAIVPYFMTGVAVSAEHHNSSICDVLHLPEKDGYCILKEDAKYEWSTTCIYGNFRIEGRQGPSASVKVLTFPHRLLYGAFIGCPP